MKRSELLDRVASIRQHTSGGQRAPHKPLLLLLALARVQRGQSRLVAFPDVEEPLRRLLVEYGPQRRSYHPEYPFWHLRADGLWEVEGAEDLPTRGRAGSVSVSTLRQGIRGGFRPDVHALLTSDPTLVTIAAQSLLDGHFAPSLHEDLLAEIGLDLQILGARPSRDPSFRLEVLRAYEYRCAMCGYDGQLETVSVAVEAAHVRWWAYDGPDDLANGLALCSLHHRVFDHGVVSVDLDHRVMVSRLFRGGPATTRLVTRLHGKRLADPQAGLSPPDDGHLRWHHREVFKGPARLAVAAEDEASYE